MNDDSNKNNRRSHAQHHAMDRTRQKRNVINHAPTADANLSLEKTYPNLAQSIHISDIFKQISLEITNMIQLFTNMIHPIGIRMITLQQNQNDVGVIHHVPHSRGNGQPEWRRGVIHHVPHP